MHNVKGTLTRKIGPLPAFAWVLVLAAGIYAARYLRAQKASATPADATATDTGLTGGSVDPGLYDQNSGDTGLLSDEVAGLQTDVSTLYDLYGSGGDGAYAAGAGTVSAGPTGTASAAAPASPAVAAPAAAPDTKSVAAAPAPLVTGNYDSKTGDYTTPEQVVIPPDVNYSSNPNKPLLGPSIFAFKGQSVYSAPSPAIAPSVAPGGTNKAN